MGRYLKWSVIAALLVFLFSFKAETVRGCCESSDCAAFCDPFPNQCTPACSNHGPLITLPDGSTSCSPQGRCAATIYHTYCTNWCDCGPCSGGMCGQFCCDGVNLAAYQIVSCTGGSGCPYCSSDGDTQYSDTPCDGACGGHANPGGTGYQCYFTYECPTCNAYAPTGLHATGTGSTRTLTWGGSGGTGNYQLIYVGTVKSQVQGNCQAGSSCIVKDQVAKNVRSYVVPNIEEGTVYYYKVINFHGSDCSQASSILADLSSCNLTPSPLALKLSQSAYATTNITAQSSGAINEVIYSTITTMPNPEICEGYTHTKCNKYPLYCVWHENENKSIPAQCNQKSAIITLSNPVLLSPTTSKRPSNQNQYVFQTLVTGIRNSGPTDTTKITGKTYLNDHSPSGGDPSDCTSTINATVNDTFNAWWQVKNGDVTTNGDLDSAVPGTAGLYFDIIGNGGYPGIPAYGGSTSTLTGANVSVNGWLANSSYNATKVYNSAYFLNAVPTDISVANGTLKEMGSTISQTDFDNAPNPVDDYYWYEYDSALNGGISTLTISDVNLGTKKAIFLVKGADVNLTGKISLDDGLGFFLLSAQGDINVDPAIGGGATPGLEGIYVTDGSFKTGTMGTDPATDIQLWTRGTVAAYAGINLQRNLSDNSTTPAELFEFAPDQELLFPKQLGARSMNWQEVAP